MAHKNPFCCEKQKKQKQKKKKTLDGRNKKKIMALRIEREDFFCYPPFAFQLNLSSWDNDLMDFWIIYFYIVTLILRNAFEGFQ